MAEDLWERLKCLEREEEAASEDSTYVREELVKIVAKLFHHHLGFALDKDVSEMLWGSQSRLYQRMRKELDKQLTSPRNGKRRELYMKIAKLNCESVLNTLRAEWIQLALLVESSDGRKIVIFPIEEPNSALCALDDADATKRFSSLFHAKVGEIASWKEELSKP